LDNYFCFGAFRSCYFKITINQKNKIFIIFIFNLMSCGIKNVFFHRLMYNKSRVMDKLSGWPREARKRLACSRFNNLVYIII
jgi:hypothetical protein